MGWVGDAVAGNSQDDSKLSIGSTFRALAALALRYTKSDIINIDSDQLGSSITLFDLKTRLLRYIFFYTRWILSIKAYFPNYISHAPRNKIGTHCISLIIGKENQIIEVSSLSLDYFYLTFNEQWLDFVWWRNCLSNIF